MSDTTTHSALAPIALFAFKRPDHTLRALQALAENEQFMRSPLHVFCDAARREDEEDLVQRTREVVRRFPHPAKTVVEQRKNQGLAASITSGVSALCKSHGRVIVLEDDLLVAPTFLNYINRALARYANEERLMQVSGYMFPLDANPASASLLLPLTTSWGWATWQRAWAGYDATAAGLSTLRRDFRARLAFDLEGSYPYFRMLQQQLAGGNDSWAIKWYLSVFLRSGLVLFPSHSLVDNIGFDGSGTHCARRDEPAPAQALSRAELSVETNGVIDEKTLSLIRRHLKRERGLMRSLIDWKSRLVTA